MADFSQLTREDFQDSNQRPRISSGWQSLGARLGGAAGGGSTPQGDLAAEQGMRVGAQTADALAQAKQRVTEAGAREQAAQALESPQTQAIIGIKPEEGAYAASLTRAGAQPENIASTLRTFLSARQQAQIGNANAPLADRHAAAFALAPASMAPKAEGAYGSTFDPGENGGSGQTTVGTQQAAIGQSEIARNSATGQAALENAAAHSTTANATATGSKPPSGYRVKLDPDTMEPVLDNTGRPAFEPIPGLPPKGESAVNSRYHQVVLQAANGLSREADNLSKMGITNDRGATGFAGAGHGGILNTISDNLGKTMSSTDQQQYNSSMTNVGRYMAMIENAGRMPPGTMSGQIDQAVKNGVGTTEGARLYNAALIRQTIEAGQDTVHASTADQPVKDQYDKAVTAVQKAIPFAPNDVIDFERDGKGQSISDFLKSRSGATAAPAAAAGGATSLGNGWTVVKH